MTLALPAKRPRGRPPKEKGVETEAERKQKLRLSTPETRAKAVETCVSLVPSEGKNTFSTASQQTGIPEQQLRSFVSPARIDRDEKWVQKLQEEWDPKSEKPG